MKIKPPKGWFARILLGGWALLLTGTLGALVLRVLVPYSLDFVTPLGLLSVLVTLGTLGYAAAFAVSRLYYYLDKAWRKDASFTSTIRPVERVLFAGWILFILAALGTLPFSQQKWVQAFGPEILFSLFCIVMLSSTAYASYVLLRQVMKYIRRG